MATTESPLLLTPSNDSIINIQSNDCKTHLHSCSLHKFFNQMLPDQQTCTDIRNLIAKYYTPTPSCLQTVEESLKTAVGSLNVQCNSIPIPSWSLTPTTDQIKRYPSLCPYFSQHLTLEILFWLLLILFFNSGVPNMGSLAVLFVFYGLIQCMIWCMGCVYKDGFYRYKHIISVPLYDNAQRLSYLNKMFDKAPIITASMDLHESLAMADMGWDTISKPLIVDECSTFIAIEDDEQYQDWFYCVHYETDIDFIDYDNRKTFEDLCVGFIKQNIREDMVYHAFNVKVKQNLISAYDGKYWSGYVMIVNSGSKMSVNFLRFMIKLLNILCLSLLYKIPLFFVREKRLRVSKYLGFAVCS